MVEDSWVNSSEIDWLEIPSDMIRSDKLEKLLSRK